MPWAPRITAVLTPITSPAEEASAPPELPGFSAASVWITSSIGRPDRLASVRPSAETTPAVTVAWKPNGAPIATAIWPCRSRALSPSRAAVSPSASARSTATSVSASLPRSRAGLSRPPAKLTRASRAPAITWWLVTISPSGASTTPEPPPRPRTARAQTAGPTVSATPATLRE